MKMLKPAHPAGAGLANLKVTPIVTFPILIQPKETAMKSLTSLFAASAVAFSLIAAPVLAADTYKLDPTHTEVTFQWTHMGFSKPTGKFMNAVGSVTLDEADPAKSSVAVSFDINGINTGVTKLDDHLKSPDFFDAAKFPTATFKSTNVQVTSPTTAKVTGDLTLHGVTKPVTLDVTLNKLGEHPMKKKKAAGFSATGTIKRSDFGMAMFVPAVSDEIDLEITAEAVAE
jgi:polyisoprenoid-binding protein YceI